MNSKNKKLVLFDFDGVLVNTLFSSFNELKKFNKDLTWKNFQDFSLGNFHDGMNESIKDGSFVKPADWVDIYDKNVLKNLTINDIFNEIIKRISNYSHLAIVSSSYNSSIKNFLVREKIENYFEKILGADEESRKSVKIKNLLDEYKVNPEETFFITDSLGDILEGNECGINCIGVTWGIHNKDTLEKGRPKFIARDPRELLLHLENMLK